MSLWVGLLVGISALLTVSFTCVAPFAAFATIIATTLSRRQALGATLVVWLANQAAGFAVLNYPRTGQTVAWGVWIGVAALLAMLAAQWTVRRLASLGGPVGTLASFVAAFVLYEFTLYVIAVLFLGGAGAFAPKVVGQVLLINAVALVGLIGLNQLLVMASSLRRQHRARAASEHLA